MDFQASGTHNVLERILLDENAEPENLTLSLLEDITNHFSLDCQIGRGGFAEVYKGTIGKFQVAVKKLTKTHQLPEIKFHKEVECLMKAKHRNIVRFLGYCAETRGEVLDCEGKFVMADTRNWMLCSEYVPNGSLKKYITDASSGLEWQERFRIIRGICHGLQYLHQNRILHLDLKPANILIDDRMQPKITDFGLSRFLDGEQTHVTTTYVVGTLGYFAPEFHWRKASFASDTYSLGIVIVEILTGGKDYPEVEDVTQRWMNRLEGNTQLEQVRVCTMIGIECMETDPTKRPVARHIIDMLDRTTSADETGNISSLVELQVNLLKEQSDQESIGSLKLQDINEQPETEDVARHIIDMFDKTTSADETGTSNSLVELQVNLLKEESDQENIGESAQSLKLEDTNEQPESSAGRLGNDAQEGQENIGVSPWESQDKDKKANRKGTSIPSSNSSVLDKWSIFNIFRKDAAGSKLKGLKIYTKEEMKKITRNYSTLYGQGCFGSYVYIGCLPEFTIVAVLYGRDKKEEFHNVLEIQTQTNHTNILKLIGCCLEVHVPKSLRRYAAAVYEFMPKGDLNEHLRSRKKVLSWGNRYKIVKGLCSAVQYLHHQCPKYILHRDIKPSNILLDENFNAKLSNFSISIRVRAVGDHLYTDPLCMIDGEVTYNRSSDVYSFGIVLLEIAHGKNDPDKVRKLHRDRPGSFVEDVADKRLGGQFDKEQMERVLLLGLRCANPVDEKQRPSMVGAMQFLHEKMTQNPMQLLHEQNHQIWSISDRKHSF